MRGVYALAIAFGVGFVLGVSIIAVATGRSDYRALAEQAQNDLDRSRRELDAARTTATELAHRNTELEDALKRAERRNSQIAASVERAERDVTDALSTATELSQLITHIISIVETLFEAGAAVTDDT